MIIKKDQSTIQSYLEDSSNLPGGFAEEVMIPESQDEVCSILKDAYKKGRPVTFSGGGTGTSGARIPFGGVVVSMEKLDKIREIVKKDNGGFVLAEAGVLIKDLKARLRDKGLFYAYDPTEQTAFLGGTVATNASGARSFKYGSTRDSVIALKMALSDGSIFTVKRGDIKEEGGFLSFSADGKKYDIPVPAYKMPDTKNSAGYFSNKGMDLTDLFIGQEGTLACILEVTLKLEDRPEDIFSCYAFFKDENKAYEFSAKARELSYSNRVRGIEGIDALSIEFFDGNSLKLLQAKYGNVPGTAAASIFFEQEISSQNEDKVTGEWLKLLSCHGVPDDMTWVAMNEKDRQSLLDKRHAVPEAMNEMARKRKMPKVSTDLACPHRNMREMMDFYKKILAGTEIQSFLFGHIGDSHMHMNLFPDTEEEYAESGEISLKLIKKSVSLGGTVSAEHGIGKTKRKYLKLLYGEDGVREMIKVKKVLDPKLILGRGNIFEL